MFHSLRISILACAWMMLGSATPVRDNKKASVIAQTQYYWYYADTDNFMEHSTTAQAESDLISLYGRNVDTNPSAGTLVANGYSNNNYPHTLWPAVMLYMH